ncbi:S-methyl-5-thioribose-1-phosphate isomerase [Methanofollis formosanus]|uniref:Putative methylthioribose-1-phosphate isomerase n=1 Tax=Methanofollis formosanus TaxID=299308 RepID=A0A8G1EHA8_9EURY|nr:S-methyl-5-thioribose-1-phosphate isomerase [Methanofollis formosanus]QYZ79787.1 S-methyl-5-thioribose-1-phosphate isomerase [Methanofollis formosanus]
MIPRTIAREGEVIVFIDQTLLPGRLETVRCTDVERLATAIRRLEVRGAPALGIAGAYGVALAAMQSEAGEMEGFLAGIADAAEYLRATRPTAVNLGWGIDRVLAAAGAAETVENAKEAAVAEADRIAAEDEATCRAIGRHGAALIPDGARVLTHCNAGALACSTWGTALGVVRSAVEAGKKVSVTACETRPLLQGARLTAFELAEDKIPVRVITDSTAAFLMRKGEIDCVVVGADRITRDAVFNKIGTYMHAVCAKHHGIPFYVAAPLSTFDPVLSEAEVEIEERGEEEIAIFNGKRTVREGVRCTTYAFDATPLDLVTGIITEQGVLRPPFDPMPGPRNI